MKKIAMLTLLGAGIVMQSAHADVRGIDYDSNSPPQKASYTITLSGACKGKVSLSVTGVGYEVMHTYTGSVPDRNGTTAALRVYTSDPGIDFTAENQVWTPQHKISESLKDGKFTSMVNFVNQDDDSSVWELDSGLYDDKITCEGGQTLAQFLVNFGPAINMDAKPYTSKATLMHTHNVDSPDNATYKIRYNATGVLEQEHECLVKGDFLGDEYSMICRQPKIVKINVKAVVEGSASRD